MEKEINLLEILEKRLDKTLMPVTPEERYISNLNSRLLSEPRISIERNNVLKVILFVGLAFITGFTIFLFINEIFSHNTKRRKSV